MKKTLMLVTLLTLPALADPPKDAPIVFTVNPDGSRTIPAESWVRLAQDKAACTTERDALRSTHGVPLWVPIAVGVVALGAGAAVGFTLSKRASP